MEYFEISGLIDSWGCQKNWAKWNLEKYKGKEVTIRLNSLGGAISEAMSIADAIAQHGQVTVQLIGCNASAATWMAFAANKVEIAENALWLCHQSSSIVDIYKSAKAKDLDAIIKDLESKKKSQELIDTQIAKMYLARCDKKGKNLDDVINLMTEEKWINADTVMNWGFADEKIKGAIAIAKDKVNQMIQNVAALNLPEAPFVQEETSSNDSLVRKIIDGVKDVFAKKEISENSNSNNFAVMKKDYVSVNALLSIEGVEEVDGKVTLTNEQLSTIENSLADAKKNADNIQTVTETLNSISEEIKNIDGLNNKILALKSLINAIPVGVAEPKTPEKKEIKIENADPVNSYFE